MATLAEIRAKLQEQENRTGGSSNTGGDNAIFAFWNIPENSTSVLRFLPDGDTSNTYFWRERQMIRLGFSGVKGDSNSCLLYKSPSPRDKRQSRKPSSA